MIGVAWAKPHWLYYQTIQIKLSFQVVTEALTDVALLGPANFTQKDTEHCILWGEVMIQEGFVLHANVVPLELTSVTSGKLVVKKEEKKSLCNF